MRELRAGTTAFLSGSRVGVSRMAMARPHEEQKRTFSEHTAPQPEQVIMRTDCIAPPGEAAKACGSDSTQQLGNGVRTPSNHVLQPHGFHTDRVAFFTRQSGDPYNIPSHGSSLLEHGASENRSAPQGGVEAVERHRGHQQNPGQTDARIPRRPLGRQGKVLQELPKTTCSHQSQQAEADQQKHSQTIKDQTGHQDNGSKLAPRCDEDREEKNECDRCRPLLAQQGPEKEQDKQNRKRRKQAQRLKLFDISAMIARAPRNCHCGPDSGCAGG